MIFNRKVWGDLRPAKKRHFRVSKTIYLTITESKIVEEDIPYFTLFNHWDKIQDNFSKLFRKASFRFR